MDGAGDANRTRCLPLTTRVPVHSGLAGIDGADDRPRTGYNQFGRLELVHMSFIRME